MPKWGGYIRARVQKRIFISPAAHDARVLALKSVFVSVTLGECEQTRDPVATVPRPVTPHQRQFLGFLLGAGVREPFPGTAELPAFSAGKVPTSSANRLLCRRMDMFSQGAELMHEAFASVSNERRLSPSGDSDQRRAEVACRKVQFFVRCHEFDTVSREHLWPLEPKQRSGKCSPGGHRKFRGRSQEKCLSSSLPRHLSSIARCS